MSSHRRFGAWVLIFCSVVLSGCLKADQSTDATYDPSTDTLRLLTVKSNIQARSDSDKDYLAALWHNRSDFIPGFTGLESCLRVDDHTLLPLGLGEIAKKPDAKTVTFSLNSIKIKPGVFFKGNDDNSLCYYQQIEIPGATVDAILAAKQKELFDALASAAKDEIARRNKAEPVTTWDDFRAAFVKKPDPNEQLTDEQKKDRDLKQNPMHCLNDDSLLALITPPPEVKCGMVRHGNDVTFTLAVAAEDQPEIVKTFAVVKSAMIDQSPDHKSSEIANYNLTAGPQNTVVLSTTLIELTQLLASISLFERPKDSSTQPADPADWISRFGAKLDPTVTLTNLHDRFIKGTLPVDDAPTSEQTRAEVFKPG